MAPPRAAIVLDAHTCEDVMTVGLAQQPGDRYYSVFRPMKLQCPLTNKTKPNTQHAETAGATQVLQGTRAAVNRIA
jgi:hypothetical protein